MAYNQHNGRGNYNKRGGGGVRRGGYQGGHGGFHGNGLGGGHHHLPQATAIPFVGYENTMMPPAQYINPHQYAYVQHPTAMHNLQPTNMGGMGGAVFNSAIHNLEAENEIWTPEESAKFREHLAQGRQPQASKELDNQFMGVQKGNGYIIARQARYKILRCIVPGGEEERMSDGIYEVMHPSDEVRIAKKLKGKTPDQIERIRSEVNILQTLKDLKSAHINFMYDLYWVNGDDDCFIILEKCDGSLEDLIISWRSAGKKFSESFMWHVIEQMCWALSTCHNGAVNPHKKAVRINKWDTIVHLDIKPGNVFYKEARGKGHEDDGHATIVLGDFGCAVTKSDQDQGRVSKHGQPFGTEGFFPPEYYTITDGKRGAYGKPTDIYQLGVLIHCLAIRVVNPIATIFNGPKPCSNDYSDELNRVVKFLMHPNPLKRPSAIDVIEEMVKLGKIRVDSK